MARRGRAALRPGRRRARRRQYAEAMAQLYARVAGRPGRRVVLRARAARHDVAEPDRLHRRARRAHDRAGRQRAPRRGGGDSRARAASHPEHPGALHYLLHNHDDPAHARRALPPARTLARLAPESSHARHMPAHIFLQLGLWQDAERIGSRGVRRVRGVGRAQAPRSGDAQLPRALVAASTSCCSSGATARRWATIDELAPVGQGERPAARS